MIFDVDRAKFVQIDPYTVIVFQTQIGVCKASIKYVCNQIIYEKNHGAPTFVLGSCDTISPKTFLHH